MQSTPFYRLRELILEKYGERNFTTGCALIAWFLSYETKERISQAWVETMCTVDDFSLGPTTTFLLTRVTAEALRALFKLRSGRELYTLPETAPDFLNQTIPAL